MKKEKTRKTKKGKNEFERKKDKSEQSVWCTNTKKK